MKLKNEQYFHKYSFMRRQKKRARELSRFNYQPNHIVGNILKSVAINVCWKENEVPITWFKKGIMVGMQSHLYSFDGTQSKTINYFHQN